MKYIKSIAWFAFQELTDKPLLKAINLISALGWLLVGIALCVIAYKLPDSPLPRIK